MGSYSLSTRAQYDLVGIYKFGIQYFGSNQASEYVLELEKFIEELADRPELAGDLSALSESLKYYRFKAHVIFYQFVNPHEIFVIRILGKRMDFVQHL